MAVAVVAGLVDVLRWIGPHITLDGDTDAVQFQEAVRRPLLDLGFAAAFVGAVCIVAVRSHRLSHRARIGILAVGVLVSATLLGVGESRYASAVDPTASFRSQLQQLHVPPSWQFQAWVSQGGANGRPASWGIWTAPGLSLQSACGEAQSAVTTWSATTVLSVDSTPQFGFACTISAQRSNAKVFSRVSRSLNDLADYAFLDQNSRFPRGGAGPAIAIQLVART